MRRTNKPTKNPLITRQALETAASKENWGLVDKHLPKICTANNVTWAFVEGIRNPNANIRDFYFSLLEEAKIPRHKFEQTMRRRIFQAMLGEPAHYTKFRAACALANHGTSHYARRVLQTLKPYERDPEARVREIAKKYVKKIEKELIQKK